MDVHIQVSVSISAFWKDYARNSLQIFIKFCTLLGCGQFDACCFCEKPEVVFRFLEVCGFRFRQFSGYGDHIFQHISTKSHVRIKCSN